MAFFRSYHCLGFRKFGAAIFCKLQIKHCVTQKESFWGVSVPRRPFPRPYGTLFHGKEFPGRQGKPGFPALAELVRHNFALSVPFRTFRGTCSPAWVALARFATDAARVPPGHGLPLSASPFAESQGNLSGRSSPGTGPGLQEQNNFLVILRRIQTWLIPLGLTRKFTWLTSWLS